MKETTVIEGYFSKRNFVFIDHMTGLPGACSEGFRPFIGTDIPGVIDDYEFTPKALRGKQCAIVVAKTTAELLRKVPGALVAKAKASAGFGPIGQHLFANGYTLGEKVVWTLAVRNPYWDWDTAYESRFLPWNLASSQTFNKRAYESR